MISIISFSFCEFSNSALTSATAANSCIVAADAAEAAVPAAAESTEAESTEAVTPAPYPDPDPAPLLREPNPDPAPLLREPNPDPAPLLREPNPDPASLLREAAGHQLGTLMTSCVSGVQALAFGDVDLDLELDLDLDLKLDLDKDKERDCLENCFEGRFDPLRCFCAYTPPPRRLRLVRDCRGMMFSLQPNHVGARRLKLHAKKKHTRIHSQTPTTLKKKNAPT